ncbi:rRNA biogenesis protein rrp36 [Orbilia ellipsospora]|uniref:rRNA biogenesis protein RRP36 n=1 Tax=Orbilia ellipsospora TaxID=2528407 RepID=A0AAV9XIN0_9PEZI
MLNRRVKFRHEDSDIEEDVNDWSDEAEGEFGESSDSDAPSRPLPAAKSRRMGLSSREIGDEGEPDDSDDSSYSFAEENERSNDDSDNAVSESEDDGAGEQDVAADIATISFGALAKAQRSLKRKRDEPENDSDGGEAVKPVASGGNGLRNESRLADIKGRLQSLSADPKSSFAESLRKAREKRREKELKAVKEMKPRSNKHAPTEMSSKKAVSRRRTVIELPTDTTRDPRFDRIGGSGVPDNSKIERNYAFLDEYRDSEIKTLRQEVAKEKNPIRKESLQKTLQSLESKRETKKRQLDHDRILAEHKKKERDAIKQGKKPFYLKKSDQKKLILATQFANMGERQRSRVIEKKRKKIASKEKKRMPWSRRTGAGPED